MSLEHQKQLQQAATVRRGRRAVKPPLAGGALEKLRRLYYSLFKADGRPSSWLAEG